MSRRNESYKYSITGIHSEDRWLFLKSDDESAHDSDAFIYLMKNIHHSIGGEILEIGKELP